jgi:hypothetical protein
MLAEVTKYYKHVDDIASGGSGERRGGEGHVAMQVG